MADPIIVQDISGGNYNAGIMIDTDGMAQPRRPNASTDGGGQSILPVMALTDEAGVPISSTNPLATTATISGDISVSTGATAHEDPQTFTEGTSNPLQADLNGNLKVTIEAGSITSSTTAEAHAAPQSFTEGSDNALQADLAGNLKTTITTPLPAGSNVIGSVAVSGGSVGLLAGTSKIGQTGVAIGSTTVGQNGDLVQGAVTTASPTYTTAQTAPLSLDTAGNLRTTGTVSGTVTVAQATAASLNATVFNSGTFATQVTSAPHALGAVTTAAPTYSTGTDQPLSIDTSGNLRVVVSGGGGGGGNAAAGLTGTTVPTSAGYTGFNSGGNLVGVSTSAPLPVNFTNTTLAVTNAGTFSVQASSIPAVTQPTASLLNATVVGTGTFAVQNTSNSAGHVTLAAPTYTTNTDQPLSLDTAGNLRVTVTGGSSANPAAGSTGVAVPAAASYTGFEDVSGNLVGASAANPFPTHIDNTSFAVTQGTAASLNATVVGTGTFATQVTALPAIPAGTNTIGAISNTGFVASQPTASALNVTAVGTGTFATQVTALPAIPTGSNTIGLVGVTNFVAQGSTTSGQTGALVQGAVTTASPTYTTGQTAPLSIDATGALRVNVTAGGGGGGGNAAAGLTGAAVPTSADFLGFSNGSGNLVGVSATNQLPVASYTATTQVQVNPTITASGYTAGFVVGGKLTFANAVRGTSGVLQSITITSKSVNAGSGYKFYLFTTNPTNSTWTDHAAPAINAADIPFLMDEFALPSSDSGLGTATLNVSDNLGRAFNAASSSLYGILVCTSANTYASTSDVFVTLTVLND